MKAVRLPKNPFPMHCVKPLASLADKRTRFMARIWNPSSSMRWMILPADRRSTASGLMIANVRSVIRRL
jgi:hypothetical protein